MADNREDKSERPIIIKRVKKYSHGAHGGVWKIAYADFMTAMMAFFLLMWLLSTASDEQLAGLAEYFAPASVSESTSGAGGILGGKVIGEGASVSNSGSPSITLALPIPNNEIVPSDEISEDELERLNYEREQQMFEETKKALEEEISKDPDLSDLAKQLIIDNTPEGLRIQVADSEGVAMFPLGSSDMFPHTQKLIHMIARVIKSMPQKLSIAGHTDSTPYVDPNGYGNWELSADRSLASRRELLSGGIKESQISRVVGQADTELFLKDKPFDASNRRISIILLRNHPVHGIYKPEAKSIGATPLNAPKKP
ncbi:MAG: flagellar motor protein MotB [Alphaproteobacteria bacterium]|nr:flagellar motor protein MotB [Alphaproteobacteria bacterium]